MEQYKQQKYIQRKESETYIDRETPNFQRNYLKTLENMTAMVNKQSKKPWQNIMRQRNS